MASVQECGRGKAAADGHHLGKLGDHVHDRFHISQHLNEAVDKVRRQENKALKEAGDRRLAGARYIWLVNEAHLNEVFAEQFSALKQADLKVSRAWPSRHAFVTSGTIAMRDGPGVTLIHGMPGPSEVDWRRARKRPGWSRIIYPIS